MQSIASRSSAAIIRGILFPRSRGFEHVRLAFAFADYPKHDVLTMPALSPTMTEGKILKWLKKEGEKVEPGDIIFEVETDKATMGFEAQDKGYLAKAFKGTETIPLGTPVAVITKSTTDIQSFANYEFGSYSSPETSTATVSKSVSTVAETPKPAPVQTKQVPAQTKQVPASSQPQRTFASPLAKTTAKQHGVNLEGIHGSGPNGRILKQDVEDQLKTKKPVVSQTPKATQKVQTRVKREAFVIPDNPFEQIQLTAMRKTIANRLLQSKQKVPHYYISSSIEMDALIKVRTELNANEKQNGVKISVNDIIVKAVALALRDYPAVNAQWHGTSIKRFKYADVSVAVAIEGGLITPIVYRADTLGLLDIARRTKDIAKRAREGKLDPMEYIGGTSSVSNLGMYGVDTVTSILNPPQSTIIGIGKTEKKILFDSESTNTDKPYRVAEVMQVIAAIDHRAVDGALAAQWLMRIKQYLEHPTQMLL